jgi:hypothetical protein
MLMLMLSSVSQHLISQRSRHGKKSASQLATFASPTKAILHSHHRAPDLLSFWVNTNDKNLKTSSVSNAKPFAPPLYVKSLELRTENTTMVRGPEGTPKRKTSK